MRVAGGAAGDRPARDQAILVVVGTDSHPFDRLMTWLERWYADRTDRPPLIVQYGRSRSPRLPGAIAFIDPESLAGAMRDAPLVVTHGGPATIIEARRTGHLPIVVPRDPAHREHVDNHQVLFARRLARSGQIRLCESEDAFSSALTGGLAEPRRFLLDAEAVRRAQAARIEAAARVGQIVEELIRSRDRRFDGRRWR